MARINIEETLESTEQFWNLFKIVGSDRDCALGKLVRFFRLAQKKYGRDQVISTAELEEHGLICMIESGWAVAIDNGYMSLGADKQFAWYKQKVSSSTAGGRARSAAPRTPAGTFKPPAGGQPEASRNEPASSPPSPSPSLSLSKSTRQAAPDAAVIEIVEYLNSRCGKNFKPESKHCRKYITARLNDGYSLGDLKRVIDTKTQEWLKNEKMSAYLTPSTLFNHEKFEQYLQQPSKKTFEQKIKEALVV